MADTTPDRPAAAGPPENRLLAMMLGVAGTQLIGLAAQLGIADLLRDGPRPIGALAEATGTQEQPLLRAMRALAALGVFAEPRGPATSPTPPWANSCGPTRRTRCAATPSCWPAA